MIVKFSISRKYTREDELLFYILLNPSSFHLLAAQWGWKDSHVLTRSHVLTQSYETLS